MAFNSILPILAEAQRLGASDIHVVAGNPLMMRLHGNLQPVPNIPVLDEKTIATLILQLINDTQRAHLEKDLSMNCTFAAGGVRYRMNLTLQRQGLEAVFRIIPSRIPTPEELQLPPAIAKLVDLEHGMILVTGPTGSGKSTTLASLLECINNNRPDKIVTIEDPIEFVYQSRKSFISQREVGSHTPSFAAGMRDVLRQDPDVVLVAELRDFETMLAAIQIADTGHLVMATMHATDAPQAIERIIDVFPHQQQQQVRAQLASNLRAVISQLLLPRVDGRGRVAAFEIMINSAAVATMIRQNRTHEIYNAIDMSSAEGMQSMTRALQQLIREGKIDPAYAPPAQTAPNFQTPPNRRAS
jgi:twitching motility protein PilT